MVWNKGLTKFNNDSVKMVSEKKKLWWETHDTSETRKKIGLSSKGRIKGMELHPSWKGGRYKDSRDGYIFIRKKDALSARSDGYVPEHRYVMEKILGRKLSINEQIHHVNAIKDDNRPENLKLVVKKNHFGNVKCPCCNFEFEIK